MRKRVWATAVAAVAEAIDKNVSEEDKGALLIARLKRAGFIVGDYEPCPICGALMVPPNSHRSFHQRTVAHPVEPSDATGQLDADP